MHDGFHSIDYHFKMTMSHFDLFVWVPECVPKQLFCSQTENIRIIWLVLPIKGEHDIHVPREEHAVIKIFTYSNSRQNSHDLFI